MAPRDLSLPAVLDAVLNRFAGRMHVSIPARVERYDAAAQQVDAQPLVQNRYTDENGDAQTERMPVVTNVPVMFPGSGAWAITFPIAVGDTVLLVFADQSLDVWLSQGGEVDPRDTRRHHLSDAVAIPGLRPFSAPSATPPAGVAFIGQPGGGNDAVALAQKVDTALSNIKTWLTAHTHAGVTTGVGTSGPAALPAPSTPAVGSGTVKVST